MKKAHFAVVIVSVGAHFAYLLYLPSGGFLALRWPRTIWLHLASVCWGVAVVTLPVPCPLTSLEDWARARAGMQPLPSTGFVDRYVEGVLYPPGRTGAAQALAFIAAAVSWVALASRRESHPPLPSLPGRTRPFARLRATTRSIPAR
ncbi:hypothetical protein A5787_19025 [Mycobacterium sp. 852002-50816_SCH5313054-b]|uniref:DUF2784 domain-containing protein n=1 Tax=Mycobacterium sp. 852002-50816_SCH5313054-b TaxID=1834092 RepID=UPI0007FEE86E|nr:DUF2784 domain-containing protein [Mycobacterium sp. 852002-50816_SCH5313054-b]OBF60430.1 hypothetical protein A5787_19025 [Mycobacterium sp. 852002-50816_SCH5313054-b]